MSCLFSVSAIYVSRQFKDCADHNTDIIKAKKQFVIQYNNINCYTFCFYDVFQNTNACRRPRTYT